jgi:cyclopropane-fatty-acyl-phospholipid synthase
MSGVILYKTFGSRFRARVEHLLARADVQVDGRRAWDIQVQEEAFFARVLAQGSLGLGESFMEGWWDTDALDQLLTRLLRAGLDTRVRGFADVWLGIKAALVNMQTARRARAVGNRHYDLGNDLFSAMLGRRLVYSCAYWREATDLDAAQEAKLDLVCRKLQLEPGMRIVDIGCGWGEALKFAAERYGVEGVGITISERQARYARELCRNLPIEIRVQDYRQLDGSFERAFSLGMFEHVGVRNYPQYFRILRRCLPRDGLFLLHTIANNRSTNRTDPWIGKYIFPNSMLPSPAQIARAAEPAFVLEDWHNFGADYERTLIAWRTNFERAWPTLAERYDERFRRMWQFYLACSIATFRTRQTQLWQVVLSPEGLAGGYQAPR